MKLYFSPTSPFVRKCRIVAHEHGVTLDLVRTRILDTDDGQPNPLLMVPSLELDDGSFVADSRVICHVLSAGAPRSLQDRVLEAVADGLCDRVVARTLAQRGDARYIDPAREARRLRAIRGTLDHLDAQERAPGFGIGDAALVATLTYLDLRHPDIDWREGRANLADWLETQAGRDSVVATEYAP